MVAASRAHPEAIVTASRWAGTRRGRFEGYDPVKRVLNALFQRLFRVLYGSQLSDVTYGFRLFPTLELQNVAWQELRHAFLFETIAKPLRLGVHVVEIPTSWRARIEGRSSNSFVHHLAYVRVALQARFADPRSFRRGPSEAPAAARLAPEAGA
jgi:hypothetical protein